jgi:hypothetical protein
MRPVYKLCLGTLLIDKTIGKHAGSTRKEKKKGGVKEQAGIKGGQPDRSGCFSSPAV